MWKRPTWELIWELAKTDFKLRYSGSRFGYLWSLLKPFLTFLIIYLVFSHFFHREVEHYALHLLIGIVLWTYFSEGTKLGMSALVTKARLLTKVPIPSLAILLSTSWHVTLSFGLSVLMLGLFFVFVRFPVSLGGVAIALSLSVLLYFLVLGFSLLTAPLYVRWRDLGQFWDLVLRLGFYASPIIYPLSAVPESYQRWLRLNPVGMLIHYTKDALLLNQLPRLQQLIMLVAVVAVIWVAGIYVLKVWHKTVIEYL